MPRPGSRNGPVPGKGAATIVLVGAPLPGVGSDDLHVPDDAARAVGVSDGQSVEIRAGGASARAVIRIRTGEQTWRPGSALARRLFLAPGVRLQARWDAQVDALVLGPFIGVLALRTRRGAAYGDHDPFFRALTRQGRRLAAPTFVFSPADVDWRQQRVAGFVSSATSRGGGWRRQSFPLPDVVYDRVQTRRAEASPDYGRFRRRLEEKVDAWFNGSGFFDKWNLHTLMWTREGLRPYLPETRRLSGPEDLERLTADYPVVYVKPAAGSLGAGILKVTRLSPRGFAVQHQIGEATFTRRAASLRALTGLVVRLTRGRPCIVQQGLPLARWYGRPFDVRMLMQRGADGQWAVTKTFSRIAARGGITSNLTRGADALNIHPLLRHVYGRRGAPRMYRQLYAAGLYCAGEIAAALPGLIGELGLDLGLTRGGRIWLIEANSKPFLQMNREAGSAGAIARSVRRPLGYAMHLAGF